ncbi:MAG: Flp pilus assembly complex ATPase component TadA [Pelosinus sp.]|nr:Flp pilus assembly complex ATPase component TadA [Pelosinus sp.]
MVKGRKRLGDLLIEAGILTQEKLDKALGIQKKTGERLGKILLNLGYVSENDMIEALELQLGIPHVVLADMTIDKSAAASIPVAIAERYQAIPIKKDGKRLTVAMVDPTNFYAIDDIRMVSGCEVDPVIATERDVMRSISRTYGVSDLVEKAVNKLRPEDAQANAEVQTVEDAPIIAIVNSIFSQAIRERASDIHIEPQDKNLRVRFRIDGVLKEMSVFTRDLYAAMISRIKIMANMDIAERRVPQDGRIKIKEDGREIDIRVSTLPTIIGEKVVMRILDKKAVILDINRLGFSSSNISIYKNLYIQSFGMILVTGPTGSGKSTTLYSTLGEVNTPEKNIITVEDPVEYRMEGINQVQVNHKAGLDFASALRSILRQDPNIVMLGEIRDGETADIAIRAALTGHLVLSTLHTNDAPGAITRLIDMGVESFLVASAVLGILAQRLVRVICPECKETYVPEPDSIERTFLGVKPDERIVLYRGKGCSNCNHSGYRGRMSIHEVMPINTEIRELTNRRASTDEIRAAAVKIGMTSLQADGINKALQGFTTIREVMRVAYTG